MPVNNVWEAMSSVIEIVLVALLIAAPFAFGLYVPTKRAGLALIAVVSVGGYFHFRMDFSADDAFAIAGFGMLLNVLVWGFARAIRGRYVRGKSKVGATTRPGVSPNGARADRTRSEREAKVLDPEFL